MPRDLPRHTTGRPRARAGAVLAALLLVAAGTGTVLAVQHGRDADPARDLGLAAAATLDAPVPDAVPTLVPVPAEQPSRAPTASTPPTGTGSAQTLPPPAVPSPPDGRSADEDAATPGVPATLAPGVVATVRTVTPVRAVPSSDGAQGPGLVVRLAVRNGSGAPVDLDGLVVEAAVAGAPAPASAGGVAAPMTGTLSGDDQASGTYVFRTRTSTTAPVLLQVGLAGFPAVGVTAR